MSAVYSYAITRAVTPAAMGDLRGVDGAPVRLVGIPPLWAVVTDVEMDEGNLRERLDSLSQLEALARAHHSVVEAVAAQATVIPLRLATIHSGDDSVADVLRRDRDRLVETLDRLAGRVELGVKVYVRTAAAGTPRAAELEGSPTSGRDYLLRRRQQRDDRDEVWRRAVESAGHVDAVLSTLAADRCHHGVQQIRLAGGPGGNVLNAAYLVDGQRVAEFTERVHRLDRELTAVWIELTGPWPAYSFASGDEGAP